MFIVTCKQQEKYNCCKDHYGYLSISSLSTRTTSGPSLLLLCSGHMRTNFGRRISWLQTASQEKNTYKLETRISCPIWGYWECIKLANERLELVHQAWTAPAGCWYNLYRLYINCANARQLLKLRNEVLSKFQQILVFKRAEKVGRHMEEHCGDLVE